MKLKEPVTVALNRKLAGELRSIAKRYNVRLGMLLSAGAVLFLKATPQEQTEALKTSFAADLEEGMGQVLEAQPEQQRIATGKRERESRK